MERYARRSIVGGLGVGVRATATGPVQDRRDGRVTMRMIHPMYGAGDDPAAYTMSPESLSGAFDVLVHVRTTTPSRLLPWLLAG